MNNIVNMVNYYLVHKNADDSVLDYLKNKIDKSSIEDLIIIQIELLYTDPTDKLVSNLVSYINEKINNILKDILLGDLANLISTLNEKTNNLEIDIDNKQIENEKIFKIIKLKDLNKDNLFDDKDQEIASELIEKTKNNEYLINKNKSIIR